MPGVLVHRHAPLPGERILEAVSHSVVLEEVAKIAFHSLQLKDGITDMDQMLLDKHYLRKHGSSAYYGQ